MLCKSLFAYKHQRLCSKIEAGEWSLSAFDSHYRNLIKHDLHDYISGTKSNISNPELREFEKYCSDLIDSLRIAVWAWVTVFSSSLFRTWTRFYVLLQFNARACWPTKYMASDSGILNWAATDPLFLFNRIRFTVLACTQRLSGSWGNLHVLSGMIAGIQGTP